MALVQEDDVFFVGEKSAGPCGSLRETDGGLASRVLSSCETPRTPRRSPKKASRITAEKSIGTTEMMQYDIRAITPETPTKTPLDRPKGTPDRMSICDSERAPRKSRREFMASSQSTYYEGEESYDDLIAHYEAKEVELLLDPLSQRNSSGSSSSVPAQSSLSSAMSAPTSITSLDSTATGKPELRRKRSDSPLDDSRRRRAKPTLSPLPERLLISKKADDQSPGLRVTRPCASSATVTAAHNIRAKQDRPIPRHIRNPGHCSPITSTSRVDVSTAGVLQSDTSSVVNIAMVSPVKQVGLSDSNDAASFMAEAGNSIEAVAKRPTANPCRNKSSCSKKVNAVPCPKAEGSSSRSPVIIAHDKRAQKLLDGYGVEKGVQFEVARGITQGWWTWEDVTEGVVDQLCGTNSEKAGRVGEVIGKGPKESSIQSTVARQIYAELDREQLAFLEGKGRGLGLMGAWQGKENWHGGCVQLTCKLEFNRHAEKDQPPFFIRLNGLRIGKSNRAARLITSLSVLQLNFEKEALYDDKKYQIVVDHLSKHLVICGRQYHAFCTKEGKIFFMETNEDFEREARKEKGDDRRLSFRTFMKTINPMGLNRHQAMNKWLARWQLILSTSRPVIEFQAEDIHFGLKDIYGCDSGTEEKQPRAETIMTDGCGWINLSALRQIAAITNTSCPVVVQGRIAGAKGLWLLHPDPKHRTDLEPPKIWIRDSQLKIKLPPQEKWDRSLRIFDLVRLPRLTVPSGLNMQTIMNMSHNGVKDSVFVKLMEAGLMREIEGLTKWVGDKACVKLAKAVQEAGNLMASRRARGAGGEARLYSFVRDENDDDDDDDVTHTDGLVERDPTSGCPSSLYESANEMLVAGFTPLENPVLRDKLKYILKETIKGCMEKFHITVLASAEAFIAPDPHGVLEEGEIFFRSTRPVSDPTVSIDPYTFLGPVLVGRNPTRVASDVRKVTAVCHDRLLSYTDVILFSTKGNRSLASYLGGGDYDGDTVTITSEPTLVDAFSDSEDIPEPLVVREAFEEEVEKVSAFLKKVALMGTENKNFENSKKVLRALSNGKVGLYSKMHDNAVYELGYNDKTTVRLAYMFTTCLDAVKSGLRIKGEVFSQDSQKWNVPRPECMQTDDESLRNQNSASVRRRLIRPHALGPFVLDVLRKCAKNLKDEALADFERLDKDAWSRPDGDLAMPYIETQDFAKRMRKKYGITGLLDDLERIELFVKSLCEEYISEVGPQFANKSPRKNGGNGSTSRAKSVTQINYDFSRRFEEGLSDLDFPSRSVKEIKASYAHIYGTTRPESKLGRGFGFAVAHDTLLAIKVQQKGGCSISRECRDFTTLINSKLFRSSTCIE